MLEEFRCPQNSLITKSIEAPEQVLAAVSERIAFVRLSA